MSNCCFFPGLIVLQSAGKNEFVPDSVSKLVSSTFNKRVYVPAVVEIKLCFRLSSNICVPNKLKGCLAGFQFLTLLNADSWHALLTVQHLSGFHNITTQPSSPPRLSSHWL